MKTPVGIDKTTGKIRFIQDVETNGLACNCRCPNESCGADLIARFCKDKENHFAHHRKKGGTPCQEKALHLLAKHLIASKAVSFFPVLSLNSVPKYSFLNEIYEDNEAYFGEEVSLSEAREEVNLPEFAIKPDILCRASLYGIDTEVAIEVKVTHAVDEEKLRKIERANLSCFEIDLSDLVSLSELTLAQVEDALSETHRYKWLHITSKVDEKLQTALDDRVTATVKDRDKEISLWQHSIVSFLNKKGHISLPPYQYPEFDIQPEIIDISGFRHKVSFPKPPKLEKKIIFSEITPLEEGVMVVETIIGGKVFPLPVIFRTERINNELQAESYLYIDWTNGLPDFNAFESSLQWGRSEKAERYIEKVTRVKHETKAIKDSDIKARIDRRLDEYQQLMRQGPYPISKNAPQIASAYEKACTEFKYKGINKDIYMVDLVDGWIFGCPQEHWQTLLLRALCIVNNEYANVKYYANSLKEFHNIEAVEPIKSLGYLKSTMSELGYHSWDIPTTYGVIISYFDALTKIGLMRYSGRGNYSKGVPYGDIYRRMPLDKRIT